MRFGKIGANGQTTVKDLGSAEATEKEAAKLLAEKTKKAMSRRPVCRVRLAARDYPSWR